MDEMTDTYDLIVRGGIVVNQAGEGLRDIGVTAGRIAAIGALLGAWAGETIAAKGLHVLPGVIDTQVHFREPGLTQKEDLETGSPPAPPRGAPWRARPGPARRRSPTSSRAAIIACIAISPSTWAARARTPGSCRSSNGCRDAAASRFSWARRPGRCWSRTTGACAIARETVGA